MKILGSVGLTLLTLLQVLFLIVTGGIILSGIDDGGDISGLLRGLWLIANGMLWTLLFAVTTLVSAKRSRHWVFLAVISVLIMIRLTSLCCEPVFDAFYLVWLPVEAFAYLLWKYPVQLKHRILFTCVNLALYGAQFVLVSQ